jgi:hypothetical protein
MLGFYVAYGPSKHWPMEKHLQFRLCLWNVGLTLYFNPTKREIDRVHGKHA